MAEMKVMGTGLTKKREDSEKEKNTSDSISLQSKMPQGTKPSNEEGRIGLENLPAPESAENIGANLDQAPHPINGAELAAILVFRMAEQLARTLEGNPKFSEIVAYPAVRFQGRLEVRIGFDSFTSGSMEKDVVVETSVVLIDTRMHPNMADMLRLESGVGLWHRQNTPDGRYNHLLMRPSQKVMEHILRMAKELGKQNGMNNGINKQEGK